MIGDRRQESGVRSQESGVRSQESGEFKNKELIFLPLLPLLPLLPPPTYLKIFNINFSGFRGNKFHVCAAATPGQQF
ncbi:hypothetical protein [Sphaerospermopsis sp. FACHB-1194]|uniref:hypothetical protein n=1 Tax=Sphaerospermopsis sp. FACHB-1194 TaxID=2692862 RepID=UPI0016801111|nr:hypothetical protein [Sphaerospermopsis sp. FACHB-1194]MBD2135347.1 hypothetical protein [Sphaerospermopsis sp. FACHB-1094]MBD2147195.1 hypothetical protein [Sphaerospermopsis sp. FACHB-1194]